MTATWVSAKPCVTCFGCSGWGPWFATGHWLDEVWRLDVKGTGQVDFARNAAPLCCPGCADWFAGLYDGPVFDRYGVELRPWLEEWRQRQQGRAA